MFAFVCDGVAPQCFFMGAVSSSFCLLGGGGDVGRARRHWRAFERLSAPSSLDVDIE